jgi:hypothetical protein
MLWEGQRLKALRPLTLPASIMPLLMLMACVFVPTSKPVYDRDCRVTSKEFELQPVVLQGMQHCHHEECAAMLVVAGAVAATSAVISGSVVVLGNVAYWLEKQGQCNRNRIEE